MLKTSKIWAGLTISGGGRYHSADQLQHTPQPPAHPTAVGLACRQPGESSPRRSWQLKGRIPADDSSSRA